MSSLVDLYVEPTSLASQLAESQDPEALRLRADECEAAAMACDRVGDAAKVRGGNPLSWRFEYARAADLRSRARRLRGMALRLEGT